MLGRNDLLVVTASGNTPRSRAGARSCYVGRCQVFPRRGGLLGLSLWAWNADLAAACYSVRWPKAKTMLS